MTIDSLLEDYQIFAMTDVEKGERFERLMRNFLLTYPVWRGIVSEVWRWKDFPFKNELGGKDLGIDLVVKTIDGDFWAAQCKFYAESSTITKSAVDSFISNSSRTFNGGKKFSRRLWIATSDNFTDNAREMLKNQSPAVEFINLDTLRRAQVNWALLDNGFTKDEAIIIRKLRDYQLEAVNKTHEYFKSHERGKLIMACGTSKTFTALKIAEKLFPEGKILFLVPSIILIKQTLVEWAQNADKPFKAVCVCSDVTAADKNNDEIRNVTLPIPPTTDSNLIKAQIAAHNAETMTVVLSTYQSLDKVATAQAIEMLAQHIVSRPVFDALFENYSFVKNNPVSQSLEKILAVLDTKDTQEDSEQLKKFFDSVRERCAIVKTAEDKQKIIIELYDKFFQIAAPKTVERLGIVYTPVEVVDFILRSVDDVLYKNFGRRITDKIFMCSTRSQERALLLLG